MITLTIHSDLSAVGFLARITDKLAKAGISVNVCSGYYHDHLFVPIEKANNAIDILKRLSASWTGSNTGLNTLRNIIQDTSISFK